MASSLNPGTVNVPGTTNVSTFNVSNPNNVFLLIGAYGLALSAYQNSYLLVGTNISSLTAYPSSSALKFTPATAANTYYMQIGGGGYFQSQGTNNGPNYAASSSQATPVSFAQTQNPQAVLMIDYNTGQPLTTAGSSSPYQSQEVGNIAANSYASYLYIYAFSMGSSSPTSTGTGNSTATSTTTTGTSGSNTTSSGTSTMQNTSNNTSNATNASTSNVMSTPSQAALKKGLSTGEIVALVLVPVLAVGAIGTVVFIRRRRMAMATPVEMPAEQ